ncbi:cytochrome c oxidase assembly protein [Parvularcula maris]|uniref:Cytochrome c oxidase assembly protein CtaG n=1 Tax=Parvularcula maris TaxID=2965077 RepID=A0A9X2L8M9_9PROT|nr:cytochrome c oxidase assembly protein [Parvularcula maris]MCQ8184222.1 cytochrome c oxidase assembly protein [Parvularcula maris]
MVSKNGKVAASVALVAALMVGASFAAVPLYRIFCQVTGWGGTTQVAKAEADRVLDRRVTVRFDASIAKGIPWSFKPAQVSQTLRIGETGLAYYEATNNADYPVIGSASFNVQPAKAGSYFMKVDCFCFEEQILQPGETMLMPVTYYVDPEMADERRLDDVREITLSYTFYRNEDAEEREDLGTERRAEAGR